MFLCVVEIVDVFISFDFCMYNEGKVGGRGLVSSYGKDGERGGRGLGRFEEM